MNKEFAQKFLEAKKLEKEALMLLLPEGMRGHLQNIQKEIKEMLIECAMEVVLEQKAKKDTKEQGKVKKVDIG